ncbi:hypothetical protein COT72_04635 [archaeon CG10_big_fil_rev_8_21_14_0_10_43_11]|nr:MAG: hypothetical protein COT72_04635 [archaeon CG10_big_fil_rev_8_21_14_0_10_43_11]
MRTTRLECEDKTRTEKRARLTDLFEDVGNDYLQYNVADPMVYQSHDVHAFYHLTTDLTKVVHVQGYLDMSSDKKARVLARLLDYEHMLNLREQGCGIGNEHNAVIKDFNAFKQGIEIDYDPKTLETVLAQYVLELVLE